MNTFTGEPSRENMNIEPSASSIPPESAATDPRELAAAAPGWAVVNPSVTAIPGGVVGLARRDRRRSLLVISSAESVLQEFEGERFPVVFRQEPASLVVGQASTRNAVALRRLLPFLNPRPIGLVRSAGCGDRLGLATPGHIRAFRHSSLAPILAQQSMRENARTGRSPGDVIDDAMWGVLQEGWRDGYGADADHLKTVDDVERCAAAGFSLFTIDASEHVDNAAATDPEPIVSRKLAEVPWVELDTTWTDTLARLDAPLDLGTRMVAPTREDWSRAAAKYARVVLHASTLARRLSHVMGGRPYEIEMSIDESDSVTSLAEHAYIAAELQRLNVNCVSLAPRYVGEFMKGVDYEGDVAEFERSLVDHLAVAQRFGPYKLSLHSGSDKFRIYPAAAKTLGAHVHLKTSGTSYVEALRAVAMLRPPLFRDIVTFAQGCYASERVGYHVSGDVSRIPALSSIDDQALPQLVDHYDARQVLHVAFGALFRQRALREDLFATLRANEEVYETIIEAHFTRHFGPFA